MGVGIKTFCVIIAIPFLLAVVIIAETWDYLRDMEAYNYFNGGIA